MKTQTAHTKAQSIFAQLKKLTRNQLNFVRREQIQKRPGFYTSTPNKTTLINHILSTAHQFNQSELVRAAIARATGEKGGK
jgi:hypothetical protein